MTPASEAKARSVTQQALIALSLANLCWVDVWVELLPALGSTNNLYYFKHFPARIHYPVALFGIAALAGVLLAARQISQRVAALRLLWPAALLAATIVALNAVRLQLASRSYKLVLEWIGRSGLVATGVLVLAAGGYAICRQLPKLVRICEAAAIVLSPLFFAFALQAVLALTGGPSRAALEQPSIAGALAHTETPGHRVAFIIFDELDQYAVFDDRVPSLEMPNFDGLLAHAFHATNAYPPGLRARVQYLARPWIHPRSASFGELCDESRIDRPVAGRAKRQSAESVRAARVALAQTRAAFYSLL